MVKFADTQKDKERRRLQAQLTQALSGGTANNALQQLAQLAAGPNSTNVLSSLFPALTDLLQPPADDRSDKLNPGASGTVSPESMMSINVNPFARIGANSSTNFNPFRQEVKELRKISFSVFKK